MARNLEFKLILDALGFQRGADAAGNALKKLGSEVKSTSDSMKPLAGQLDFMGGIVQKLQTPMGAAIVGIGAMGTAAAIAAKGVADLAAQAEELQKAATRTGIGLQGIQEFKRTAENMGYSLETVTGAVSRMQKALEGNGKSFRALGIDVSQFKALAPEDQFTELASKIAALDEPSQRAAAAFAIFGKSGAELLPLLIKVGTEGTDAIVTMSDKQIAAFGRLDDALDNSKGAMIDFKNQVLASLSDIGGAEGINILTTGLRGLAQYLKESRLSDLLGDLATGKSLANAVDAANRAGMYQGRLKDNGKASIFQPTGGLSFDPMGAWKEMDTQKSINEEISKTNRLLDGELERRKRIAAAMAPVKNIYENFNAFDLAAGQQAAMNYQAPIPQIGESDFNALNQELFGAGGPDVGAVPLQFTQWAEGAKNFSEKLGDIAHQLQILESVSSGAIGAIAQLAVTIAQSAQVGQSMKANWDKGGKTGKAMAAVQGVATLGSIYNGATTSYGKSALSGVASGAAAGSAFGPWGAVVGGVVGGIAGLLGSAKKNKQLNQAAGIVGKDLAKQMVGQFTEQAKAEGKTIAQVAKEWLEVQRKELRKSGMADAKAGVESMTNLLGVSPEITAIAAKNFNTLFWETVKDEGWVEASAAFSDIFAKLKGYFGENMPASLVSIGRLMDLSQNAAVSPYLQAAQAQGQFVTGAMNGGFYSGDMQGDSAVIARQTIGQLKANGATDKESYQAIGQLLKANLNAAIASGSGISADLQALLDEAKANGVNIVADVAEQQLAVLRAIYKQLGGNGDPVTNTSGGSSAESQQQRRDKTDPAGGGGGDTSRLRLVASDGRRLSSANINVTMAPWMTVQDRRQFAQHVGREVQKKLRNDPGLRFDQQRASLGGR